MNKKELIAPCGIDCFNCPVYECNITGEIRKAMAASRGVKEDEVPCKGCLAQKGHFPWLAQCATYECVTQKGFRFCFECGEFPCSKLQPLAEGANHYPHNLKVYNLCRMKTVGVKQWAEKESLDIRNKYYKGKFKIGAGPQL